MLTQRRIGPIVILHFPGIIWWLTFKWIDETVAQNRSFVVSRDDVSLINFDAEKISFLYF